MTQKHDVKENLEAKAKRWRAALADSATGPLIVAGEIVALASEWAVHKEEAGGKSCTGWLREVTSFHLGYYRRRANAVERLGEAARRTIHHEVAIWVAENVDDGKLDAVKFMLMRECKANGNLPLSPDKAIRRIHKLIGRAAQPKPCSRCAELESLLRQHGVEVPA